MLRIATTEICYNVLLVTAVCAMIWASVWIWYGTCTVTVTCSCAFCLVCCWRNNQVEDEPIVWHSLNVYFTNSVTNVMGHWFAFKISLKIIQNLDVHHIYTLFTIIRFQPYLKMIIHLFSWFFIFTRILNVERLLLLIAVYIYLISWI